MNYTVTPPPSFGAHIDDGHVLALGSFSKILAPGLRLGWVQAATQLVQRMVLSGLLDNGGGLNAFTSGLVRSVLELDLQRPYLAELRATYQQRSSAMAEALRRHVPDAAFAAPQGGYFFWLRLPDGLDAEALLPRADELKVSYRPGVPFSSQGGLRDYARLCFAIYDTALKSFYFF